MAEALSSINIALTLQAILTNAIDGSTLTAQAQHGTAWKPATTLSSGTGSNAADRIWQDTSRALTSGNSEDLDLYDLAAFDIGGGAGKDALGQSWALVEVVSLFVRNLTSSAGNLIVGAKSATTCWNSLFNGDDDAAIILHPGAVFFAFSPTDPAWAVADVSNHLLKFAASGGNVTYDAIVLGRSA